MKIRTGFVSNSSTSSFCIFGAAVSRSDFLEGIRRLVETGELKPLNDEWEDSVYDAAGLVGLESYLMDWGDLYVGVSWYNIDDDETGRQFKERITTLLRSIMPDIPDDEIGTHEEAYPD